MRTLSFSFALLALSCGGIAIIDDGAGGSGNASTTQGTNASSGTTKSTTNASAVSQSSAVVGTPAQLCDQLKGKFDDAFNQAIECNACLDHDPCGQIKIHDACGCIVPASSDGSGATKSEEAYAAWVGAGCGPLQCETCPGGNQGFCQATPGGGCAGSCAFAF